MKSYTTLKQSKELAKILPLDTADMCYKCLGEDPYDVCLRPYSEWKEVYKGLLVDKEVDVIPCWSLTALLDILPYPQLSKDKLGCGKEGWMISIYSDNCRYDSYWNDNPIDACYEMILKLYELKIL